MRNIFKDIKNYFERIKFFKQMSKVGLTSKGERSKRYLIEALEGNMEYRVEEFEELIENTAKKENLSRELAIKFLLTTISLVEGDKESFYKYYTEDLAKAINEVYNDKCSMEVEDDK